jgi:glycerol-3-phosphate O-acyltransferase
MNKLLGLDAGCVVRFSQPVDCFGNAVDESGVSHDARGRPIDPASYVLDRSDRPTRDPARESQYTRELGEVICAAYKRDTVIMPTHLAAAVAFDHLRRAVGHADLFALLRHTDDVSVPRARLAAELDILLDRARAIEAKNGLVLAHSLRRADGAATLDQALRAFAGYHTHEVLAPRGAELVLRDTRLLFYYQNRLAAPGLAFDAIGPEARHHAGWQPVGQPAASPG